MSYYRNNTVRRSRTDMINIPHECHQLTVSVISNSNCISNSSPSLTTTVKRISYSVFKQIIKIILYSDNFYTSGKSGRDKQGADMAQLHITVHFPESIVLKNYKSSSFPINSTILRYCVV